MNSYFLSKIKLDSSFVVIGIDLGSKHLGFAAVSFKDGNFFLLKSGVISFIASDPLPKKLFFVYNFFLDFYSQFLVFSSLIFFSVEKQIFSKNVHSFFVLVSLGSMFQLMSQIKDTFCLEFHPSEIKKMISGKGNCEKTFLFSCLKDFFSINCVFSLDESDAIATALSGAIHFASLSY